MSPFTDPLISSNWNRPSKDIDTIELICSALASGRLHVGVIPLRAYKLVILVSLLCPCFVKPHQHGNIKAVNMCHVHSSKGVASL